MTQKTKYFVGYSMTLEPMETDQGKLAGFIWEHVDRNTGFPCVSFVDLKVHKFWESPQGISFQPSLDCPTCPAHGFVKNGAWEGWGAWEPPVWSLVQLTKEVWAIA